MFRGSILVTLLAFMGSVANGAEITWTGDVDTAWSQSGNWSGGVPGKEDIAVIPNVAHQPVVDMPDTLCSGIILEDGASVSVLDGANALYIIGPGDLDGDGISDIEERELSIDASDFDADNDGIPNFAEIDSDDDGLNDGCEFTYYSDFNPYEVDDADGDMDHDGYTNLEECEGGSDPTDPHSTPTSKVPVGAIGSIVFCLIIIISGALVLRSARKGIRIAISVFLAGSLLASGGYLGFQGVLAASNWSVDFSIGQTIPGVAETADAGDALEINGASVRPWNGRSTYITKPLTLSASGGTVYLGGMRAALTVGFLGEGIVQVTSSYSGADHPSPVSELLEAGAVTFDVVLGEWFTLTATPEERWIFRRWDDASTEATTPLAFQVVSYEPRLTALFGPPGPDLATTVDTGPPDALQAGNTLIVAIRVTNIGQRDTESATWSDGLYLSRDAVFDKADLQLGTVSHTDMHVGAEDSYTDPFITTLPDVAPGHYYLLGVADKGENVTDANRNNNLVAVSVVVLDANLAQ